MNDAEFDIPEEVRAAGLALRKELLSLLPRAMRYETPVPGLVLTRIDRDRVPENCFYSPMVGLVVQGCKYSTIGGCEANYGENRCVVVGVDIPGVHQACVPEDGPFLALSVRIDRLIVSQLVAQMPELAERQPQGDTPVAVFTPPPELMDAFGRLVRLVRTPERIPVLAPLVLREIHYYLLTGPKSACLDLFNARGSTTSQIAQAIAWLRQNYSSPVNMEDLARQMNMAPSTFNRHFKQITTYSPLQFQKKLRLFEAKRLMLHEGKDVNEAALCVGYESSSQFNREYKRQFGFSPKQDVLNSRSSG